MPEPLKPTETVLAIDPGNFATAYCLLAGNGQIVAFGKLANPEFVGRLVELVIDPRKRPAVVACEMVCSYGMAAGASLFETCVCIGEFRRVAGEYVPFVLVPRLEVKLSVCKSPRANDSNIRAALLDVFGPQGSKKAPGPTYGISKDVWAALALAETVRRGEYRPYVWSNERT